MNQMRLTKLAIAGPAVACATLLSFGWSEQRGASLSLQSAQARVGRPATPMSVAGVARRQDRRAAYGYGVAGAAAVGTAAAVAATSPAWGSPYYTGTGYAGGPYYTGTGYYTGAGNYTGGPYYGGGVLGANAYYAPPAASPAPTHVGSWPTEYSCIPGTLVRPGNGLVYRCR